MASNILNQLRDCVVDLFNDSVATDWGQIKVGQTVTPDQDNAIAKKSFSPLATTQDVATVSIAFSDQDNESFEQRSKLANDRLEVFVALARPILSKDPEHVEPGSVSEFEHLIAWRENAWNLVRCKKNQVLEIDGYRINYTGSENAVFFDQAKIDHRYFLSAFFVEYEFVDCCK